MATMTKNIQIERFLKQGAHELTREQMRGFDIPPQFNEVHIGRYSIPALKFYERTLPNGHPVIDVVANDVKFPLSILWHNGSHGPLVNGMDFNTFLRSDWLTITNIVKETKVVNWHGINREIQFTFVNYTVD